MNSGAREVRHDIRVACASKREWHEHQLPEALRKLSFQVGCLSYILFTFFYICLVFYYDCRLTLVSPRSRI